MSRGGSALDRVNKQQPVGPPFIPAAAQNGDSVDGTGKIVLGNDVGGILATLLNNREIPTGGFFIALTGAGQLLIGTAVSTGQALQVAGDAVIRNFLIDSNGGLGARLFSGSEVFIQSNSLVGSQTNFINNVVGFAGNAIVSVGSSQNVPATSAMLSVSNNIFEGLRVRGDATLLFGGATDFLYRPTAVAATFGLQDHTIDGTGTFALNLPTAVGIPGRVYVGKNSGVGVVTITPFGAETIDGAATLPLAAGAFATVQSNGANWIRIA